MRLRFNWRKILLCTVDVIIGGYLIVAVTAFNKPDESALKCSRMNIYIQDEATNGFITTAEVKKRLKDSKLEPMGKPLSAVNAREIEQMLEQSAFVKKAECSKTMDGTVNISVTQRMPVVRIKSLNGEDYYVDDKDCVMPNSRYTSDLIIATGCISRSFATHYVSPLARTINESDFWRNQIVQINILPDHSVELVPRVGDHIVNIGALPMYRDTETRHKAIQEYVDSQLERLRKFYVYGLSKAGWNKYSYIDLQFCNQIICKKR